MSPFRNVIFWAHLAVGLVSGLAIGVMCFTGTALAFEEQIVAWAERDACQIPAPAPGIARLALEQMPGNLLKAQPEARVTSIVLQNDPTTAVTLNARRGGGLWSGPILIVLTLTAIPISFRWGSDLIYTLTNTALPLRSAGSSAISGTGAGPISLSSQTSPVSIETLIATVQKQTPGWKS